MDALGQNTRALRHAYDYSIRGLHKATGIARRTIRNVESASRGTGGNPTVRIVDRLADHFQVSPALLFCTREDFVSLLACAEGRASAQEKVEEGGAFFDPPLRGEPHLRRRAELIREGLFETFGRLEEGELKEWFSLGVLAGTQLFSRPAAFWFARRAKALV